jgi:hypothetical protein
LGLTAGNLWRFLGENGIVPYRTILKNCNKIVTPDLWTLFGPGAILQALGWLMREDKIFVLVDKETDEISFRLNCTEQWEYWRMAKKERDGERAPNSP